jgi:hypothetical protein
LISHFTEHCLDTNRLGPEALAALNLRGHARHRAPTPPFRDLGQEALDGRTVWWSFTAVTTDDAGNKSERAYRAIRENRTHEKPPFHSA